jgi:hypothetical protein
MAKVSWSAQRRACLDAKRVIARTSRAGQGVPDDREPGRGHPPGHRDHLVRSTHARHACSTPASVGARPVTRVNVATPSASAAKSSRQPR